MKTGMPSPYKGAYKEMAPPVSAVYLDEFAWRHNDKREPRALFSQLLARAAHGQPVLVVVS
jgi:hypothetical protein